MLGEKNDEAAVGCDATVSGDALAHCPPPRWATGLRRVLYPDVVTDDCEGETPGATSGS